MSAENAGLSGEYVLLGVDMDCKQILPLHLSQFQGKTATTLQYNMATTLL